MKGADILTGIISGTGATAITAASVYAARKIRKAAARIEEVMQAPAQITSLTAVVATNTEAIGHLSEALNRLTILAEKRVNGG